jgi:preprotein translocase subunit SecY
MLGDVFGPDIFFVLLVLGIGFGIPLWAVADAVSRPSAAFAAANSSKALWISLVVVLWFLTGIVGIVLAVVYLASIRPRVRAATN